MKTRLAQRFINARNRLKKQIAEKRYSNEFKDRISNLETSEREKAQETYWKKKNNESKPHHKEKIKEYYRDRHELNKLRKQEKQKKRENYFRERNERFAIEIPSAATHFLTNAVVNSYMARLSEKTYANLIDELGTQLSQNKSLPKGRVKQELRRRLPKP